MLEEDFKKKILAEFSDAEANKIINVLETKDLDETDSSVIPQKHDVNHEIKSISSIFSGPEWESTKQEILSSLASAVDPNDKESWGAVIEHIKNKLTEKDNRLLKFIIYYKLCSKFLIFGTIISYPLFIILFGAFNLKRLFI